jgi:hypothetical protein
MKITQLNISDKHIVDSVTINERWKYFMHRNGCFDRFWGEANLIKGEPFKFKFCLSKISGDFEIQFKTLEEFTTFLGTLNVEEHSSNDTNMYFFLMYGRENE